MSSKEINIIGGGCAAFSLARFNDLLPQYKFNLFLKDQNKPIKDHCWGFWKFKENQEAYDNSYFSWNNWAIITSNSKNIFCLLYTSPSPRDATLSRMPSSA